MDSDSAVCCLLDWPTQPRRRRPTPGCDLIQERRGDTDLFGERLTTARRQAVINVGDTHDATIARAIRCSNSHRHTSRRYTCDMTRQQKLLDLIKRKAGDKQADFAQMIGRSPQVVWQYASGHRKMGEQFARHVERKLSLPAGYMDDHQETAPTTGGTTAPTADITLTALLDQVVAQFSVDHGTEIDDAVALIDLYLRATEPERKAKLGRILNDLARPIHPGYPTLHDGPKDQPDTLRRVHDRP